MLSIKKSPAGITFKVLIQPRSSKNMMVGYHGDALKIKLTAPPVDGAANKMCIQYLAQCFDVPKKSLEIISGRTSRTKKILLRTDKKTSEIEPNRLKRLIESLLSLEKLPGKTT